MLDLYDESTRCLRVTVADTGPGIPKQLLPRMFTRYERLGRLDRHRDGSGIGLSVVKTIIDHLGGDISVESREGIGTTFVVRIPAEQVHGVDRLRRSEQLQPSIDRAKSIVRATCLHMEHSSGGEIGNRCGPSP